MFFNKENKKEKPKIRPWPYPYRAGLTISNDIEFTDWDFFETLMEFFNTANLTKLGYGLDMELTSSVFHFSANPYNFSIFDGINYKNLSKYANRLNDYLKTGWIDTLHSYGDFDGSRQFQRIHAITCLEHLNELGVKVPIFTNHGSLDNIQNVGRDADYHRGDHKGHPAYHTDLWDTIGINFIWTDSMLLHSFKKQYFNPIQKISKFPFRQAPINRPYFNSHDTTNNIMIKKIELNDGSEKIGFLRFRGTGENAPNLSSFQHQLTQIPLARFYKENRGIIIYQHLGVLYRINGHCIPVTIEKLKKHLKIYLAPFYFLAREYSEGRLWVVGCYRFLRYLLMRDSTKAYFQEDGDIYLESEYAGDAPLDYFQGLTIYTCHNKLKKLKFKGKEIPIFYNGPDETGLSSVSVKSKSKTNIWN